MPNTNQTIAGLFEQYNKRLKPYLTSLEALTNTFPQGILNEIRALFDHCARTALEGLTDENKQKEIESAKRHIYRASYDCLKELCLYYAKELEKFEKNYKNVRLGDVDSGRFFPKYIEMKREAERITSEAKHCEAHGVSKYEDAFEYYQNAVLQYDEILQFIDKNTENLVWSTQNQRKYFWSSHIISAIIGLIVGLTCNYLYGIFTN